jgi:hypothetical protein
MADMERADDFAFTFHALSATGVELVKVPIPRSSRLVKTYAVKGGAFGAAPVLTIASSKGDLADTHTIPTTGAENDVSEQDYREEDDNSFAVGSYVTVTLATGSAGDTFGLTMVFRPL